MNDRMVYKETVRLIWNDIKKILLYMSNLGAGLFIGAFGFFIMPLGKDLYDNIDKQHKLLVTIGAIFGYLGLCVIGLYQLVHSAVYDDTPNWILFKVTTATHGLYGMYWLGTQLKEYVKNKEEKAIKLINEKKRKGEQSGGD